MIANNPAHPRIINSIFCDIKFMQNPVTVISMMHIAIVTTAIYFKRLPAGVLEYLAMAVSRFCLFSRYRFMQPSVILYDW